MKPERPDPPMLPTDTGATWYESGPDPIDDDLKMAFWTGKPRADRSAQNINAT